MTRRALYACRGDPSTGCAAQGLVLADQRFDRRLHEAVRQALRLSGERFFVHEGRFGPTGVIFVMPPCSAHDTSFQCCCYRRLDLLIVVIRTDRDLANMAYDSCTCLRTPINNNAFGPLCTVLMSEERCDSASHSCLINLRHGLGLAALLGRKDGCPFLDELGVGLHRDGAVLDAFHHAVPVNDEGDALCVWVWRSSASVISYRIDGSSLDLRAASPSSAVPPTPYALRISFFVSASRV